MFHFPLKHSIRNLFEKNLKTMFNLIILFIFNEEIVFQRNAIFHGVSMSLLLMGTNISQELILNS